ncbi:MAG: radical SAM protein, partial [Desulfobacteraceae bacterium]|nr:radical SAM protein [Desulfobacteraceae bacterium]
MQANLIFSPFVKPFVPLGIAHIKSYVETNSNVRVKCFDLNLMYYKTISDAVRTSDPNLSFFPEAQRPEFLKTMDLFEKSSDGIFNQEAFDRAAIFFTNCFKSFNIFFQKMCTYTLHQNKGVPFFIPKFVNLLIKNKPDVVGFSVVYPEQLNVSLLIAKVLKQVNNNIKIVFGGNTSSLKYEELLSFQFIDFVIMNEGEKAFLDLLNRFEDKAGQNKVSNLAFTQNSKMKITKPEFIKNLNDIPFPDFSDFDLKAYFKPDPVVPILSSRGCYWRRCTFCVHHKSYFLKYRKASINRVVDELEYHADNKIKHFSFVDEMISASRFKRIGEEILKRGLDINYYALAKPTKDFDKDILKIMYKSGCRYIIWGVESGCQRILDLIDKGTKVKDISKVLNNANVAGIKNHVFIIIGFPSETKAEFKETLDFLNSNQDCIHAIHDGSFGLQKGSFVFENPKKFSITKIMHSGVSAGSTDSLQYSVSQGLTAEEA